MGWRTALEYKSLCTRVQEFAQAYPRYSTLASWQNLMFAGEVIVGETTHLGDPCSSGRIPGCGATWQSASASCAFFPGRHAEVAVPGTSSGLGCPHRHSHTGSGARFENIALPGALRCYRAPPLPPAISHDELLTHRSTSTKGQLGCKVPKPCSTQSLFCFSYGSLGFLSLEQSAYATKDKTFLPVVL